MDTRTSLTTAILVAGGAIPFAFAAQQQDEAESVRLGLRLNEGVTHRYEVTETRARSTDLPGDPHRDTRPGQPGGAQDTGAGQQPGARQQPGQPVAAGQTSVTSYEISVHEAGDDKADRSDAGVTKLEVKKTKRQGAMAGQRAGLDLGDDEERLVDRAREGREVTYIVHVTATGEIREIKLEGKDQKAKKDDSDKEFDEDAANRARLEREWGGAADHHGADDKEKVRDHLHAILGTGLHDREIRKGEVLYLGQVTTTARPIEAGTGADRTPGQTGRDQQRGVGQDRKDTAGKMPMHKDGVKLTGVAMELQAVERRGEERLARFRILDPAAAGMQDREFGREPGQRPGQGDDMQDSAQGTGIASFRVSDGLLEELTYLPRAAAPTDPVRERPGFGEDSDRQREGGAGAQDRPRDVGVDAMLQRQSVTIRRVGS